jgi:hypothetical protein
MGVLWWTSERLAGPRAELKALTGEAGRAQRDLVEARKAASAAREELADLRARIRRLRAELAGSGPGAEGAVR